jgi:hypothetical protein
MTSDEMRSLALSAAEIHVATLAADRAKGRAYDARAEQEERP